MSHHVETTGTQISATVSGALDGEAARSLCSAVRAAGFQGASVVLDMHSVASVDVEGITQLVALKRWAEREGGRLVLAAPSYEVTDALRQNGLDRIFDTAPSREAAAGAGAHASYEAPPLPFESPPSFAPPAYDAPPSFAPPPEAPHAYDPPPFAPPPVPEPYEEPAPYTPPAPPPVYRAPEPEPVRRRTEEPEENAWARPAEGKSDRAAPPVATSPVAAVAAVPRKKGKGGLIALLAILLLGAGGAAAWYFLIYLKPAVLPPVETWERMEGADAGFEIKFKNADLLYLKDSTPPADLDFDPEVRKGADGVLVQTITGNTREIGPHEFSVVARAKDGKESAPVKFSFTITAEEVRDMSGGKLPAAKVNVALKPAALELARGCVSADAPELKDTGLTIKLDSKARKAWLEGTPTKDGEIKFTLKAANADKKEKSLSYTLSVQPEEKPVVVTPPVVDPPKENPPPGTDTPPVTDPPKKETPPVIDPPKKETPPVVPAEPTLDQQTITMLRDRIDRSRFSPTDKAKMFSAVNQVQSAKKIAVIAFGNGERGISPAERQRLIGILKNTPELAKSEGRRIMDFVVVGYASNRGGAALNVAISKARASSVEEVLREAEFDIRPTFTGDYGATNVFGDDEAANRVVEIHAVIVKQEARSALDQLVEYMRQVSGSKR